MPQRVLQRNKRAEVTVPFSATGVATAVIAVPPGPAWEVKQITIHTTITSQLTQCTTFIGTNTSGVRISQTLLGNDDTDSTPNTSVRFGESLCAVWTVGLINNTATLTVIYDEVAY